MSQTCYLNMQRQILIQTILICLFFFPILFFFPFLSKVTGTAHVNFYHFSQLCWKLYCLSLTNEMWFYLQKVMFSTHFSITLLLLIFNLWTVSIFP